ncbi:hypothetical protein TNIN_139261 [Trichonephila inaurata madagascariensis]|uniref:Uncharacterized protein n=1 Tax=Trichonephila inaurata madagascariensis TaxID=2747483 RepID=A0A8X7BVY6_9ARAC|nr:hypothetical protein TNIN_139261 [Trichonephila inaurata madagascariensis]
MNFFILLLNLPLLVLAITSLEKSFFDAHGIDTNCRGNTTFGSFASCTITCQNLHRIPADCNSLEQLGCRCKPGFIPLNRQFQNLQCIRRKDCPHRIPKHHRRTAV